MMKAILIVMMTIMTAMLSVVIFVIKTKIDEHFRDVDTYSEFIDRSREGIINIMMEFHHF